MRKKITPTESYAFLTPPAARAAAGVLETQLKSFGSTKSQIEVNGSCLNIRIEGPKADANTASMCAKRLAEWMVELQKI